MFDPQNIEFHHSLSRMADGDPDYRALDRWTTELTTYEITPDHDTVTTTRALVSSYGFDPDLCRLYGEAPADAADAHSGDALHYFTALFSAAGEPREELLAFGLASWPSSALVIDRVKVDPDVRGRGLARAAMAETILTLSRSYAFVACYPAPDRVDGTSGSSIDQARLESLVSSLGFEPFHEGMWLLDTDLQHPLDLLVKARQAVR